MTDFTWQVTPEQAFSQLFDDYEARAKTAVCALLLSYAPRIEEWMKANAIWADRTGNARQSLYAELEQMANEFVLKMDHGMSYGIFLETANAGRYAIVSLAVDHFFPLIWADIEALFR